jgi:hypothetical protein
MDGEEQHREGHAGMIVLDNPEPGRRWNEGERCVQDDAEQQGKSPDCVKRVQAFRCGASVISHGIASGSSSDWRRDPEKLPDPANRCSPDAEFG